MVLWRTQQPLPETLGQKLGSFKCMAQRMSRMERKGPPRMGRLYVQSEGRSNNMVH